MKMKSIVHHSLYQKREKQAVVIYCELWLNGG